MKAKITLPELVTMVSEATSTTQRMSELFLRELFAIVDETLVAGENVTIKDLGTFKLLKSSGNERRLAFVPAKKLAEVLNQPFEAFVPVELGDDVTEQALADAAGPPVEEAAVQPQPVASPTAVETPASTETPAAPAAPAPPTAAPDPQPAAPDPLLSTGQSSDPVPVTTAVLVQQPMPSQALLEQARREVAREVAHTALWKGLAIGLVAGVLVATIMMRILLPSTPSAAVSTATADTTATTEAQPVQALQPVVTDTISKTMYLTKMAIKHYGKQEFWVYIYEENKSKIENPNNIPIGTVMVIPPASKYGINPADQASVDKAKQISFELFSKYK